MIEKNFCRITGAGANHLLENTVAISRMEAGRRFKQGMANKNLPCLFLSGLTLKMCIFKAQYTLVTENVISGRIPTAFQLNALSCSLRAVKLSSKLNCPSYQPCVPNQYAKLPGVERQLQ